jgi:ADP-ribose pyrophosphatase
MKINNNKIISSTKFLNFNETEYEDKKGNIKHWVWASRPNKTNAVVIVPYVDNKIVVIKEFRVPLNDYEYGFPAGLINDGEDPFECAKRELKEETGLDVVNVYEVSPLLYNSAGLTDEAVYMVWVECSGEISVKKQEDSEDIEVMILDIQQVYDLIHSNVKIGAKAYLELNAFYNEMF